jgi:hypothetical protein
MRSIIAFSLLISLGAPANAAAPHYGRPRRQVHDRAAAHPAQREAVPPGWYKFPGYPPIPPSENRNLDPSNFGGG